MNRPRLDVTADPEIATRIASYEMAYRMQTSAPELIDLGSETRDPEMYGAEPGKPSFANNCLLARRLVERGVRFVQLYHTDWDHHGVPGQTLTRDLDQVCRDVTSLRGPDQGPESAGLARQHAGGLGRRVRPHADGRDPRDRRPQPSHRRHDHVVGRRRGQAGHDSGRDRRIRLCPVADRVHIHDLQATILHLLGLEHTKLTFRFQGRDFRLTDVEGRW